MRDQKWHDHLARALTLWKEGHEDNANQEIQTALDLSALSNGENSPSFIECAVSAGDLLIKMGRGMEALGFYNKARELSTFLFGEANSYRPRILLGLSAAYSLQLFEEEAKLYKELALESLPETKWDTVYSLIITLAELAPSLGEDELFHKLALETIPQLDTLQTEELADLSKPILLIASNLFVVGDAINAVTMLRRVIEFHEHFEGEALNHFANCLELGASAAEATSDFETAIRWMALACEIHADIHGRESIETTQATVPLARLLLECGNVEESIRICEEVLPNISPANEGDEYKLEEATIRKILGEGLCALQEFEAAREHLLLASEIYKAHERTSDPSMCDVLHNLGVIALSEGALDDALHFLGKAYAIREKIFGTSHESVAKSLTALGTCHKARGNVAEAESCFKRARDIEASLFGKVDPLVQEDNDIPITENTEEEETEILEESVDIPSQFNSTPNPNLKAVVSIVRAAKTLIQTRQEIEAIELLNEAISLIEAFGPQKDEESSPPKVSLPLDDAEEFS